MAQVHLLRSDRTDCAFVFECVGEEGIVSETERERGREKRVRECVYLILAYHHFLTTQTHTPPVLTGSKTNCKHVKSLSHTL